MQPFNPETWFQPAVPIVDWTLLNRFQTDQRPCQANLHKWGLAVTELYNCGQWQTMGHIVDSCPLTQPDGGLTRLHEADDNTVNWLRTTAATALAIYEMKCLRNVH